MSTILNRSAIYACVFWDNRKYNELRIMNEFVKRCSTFDSFNHYNFVPMSKHVDNKIIQGTNYPITIQVV